MTEKENLFKCPNDLKVTIVKDNGEMVLSEDCCTNLSILVKNNGEMATSFLGAHSPEMIRVLDKSLKKYFRVLKKTLKAEYKRVDNEEIQVIKGTSTENSKEIEEALKNEVKVDINYEFESLKEIEKVSNAKAKTTPKKSNSTSKQNTNKKSNISTAVKKPTTKTTSKSGSSKKSK